MSCTVVAIPMAVYWIVGAMATTSGVIAANYQLKTEVWGDVSNNVSNKTKLKLPNIAEGCDDVYVISDKQFLEKTIETPFVDKELLFKTLEEHGCRNIKENEYGQISCKNGDYTFKFEKSEIDKPYYLNITYTNKDNVDEEFNDISNEYVVNVQESSYNSIIEKLKDNNMEIESEEICDDNTIVLTINLE